VGALVEQHRQGVYRFGLRVCATTEDTEDAVQETLWAATRAIPSFRGSATSVASWLFTIVRRRCLRSATERRRAPRSLDEDALTDAALGEARDGDPETLLADRRRAELLSAAIAALDPSHREVILLRDVEELSAPEAAERLGISVEALKSRLHRARAALRRAVCQRAAWRWPAQHGEPGWQHGEPG
jgi:RNA polymerase sigma-70 factor (ECF subfamily)